MVAKTLDSRMVLACGILALVGLMAMADDKKGDKPALSGTWGKKDGELKMEFADKDVMKLFPHGDGNVITITCKYTVEKEGRIKAEITGYEGKDELKKQVQERLPVGHKFNFKWTGKGDAAQLEDVTGDNVELLKSHMEGDFEKK